MDWVLYTMLWDSDLKKSEDNIKIVLQNLEAFGIDEQFKILVYVIDWGFNMFAALKNNI